MNGQQQQQQDSLRQAWDTARTEYISATTQVASNIVTTTESLATPFVKAWDNVMSRAVCEFLPNSHEWRVTAGDLQFQSTAATPWICVVNTVDGAANAPWVPVDAPVGVSMMHKVLGIKIPEKSYSYARFISFRVLFDLLARLWMVRSEMPPAADGPLVFSAEWFRQVTLVSMGHCKSIADREAKK